MGIDADDVELRLKRLESAARTAGIRLTHQRLEIYREIASRTDHPDALAVHESIKQRMPTVSLDTVYRTLWTLTDLGLITTFGPRQDSVRFDANLEQHHHFVCVKCGVVQDFESSRIDNMDLRGEIAEFGSLLGTQINVRGICNTCGGHTEDPRQ